MPQIEKQLIGEKVVAELRREILYGELKPGQELYQDMLAQELGVSRMPVREALQVLANDGFVTMRPNKVATVNEVSTKYIRDFFDIRILLEITAIVRACANRPNCKEAWEIIEKAEKQLQLGDFGAYNVQNGRIHRFIWESANNSKLMQLLGQMWNTMDIGNHPAELAVLSNEDHRMLIQCIEKNDPDMAKETIRKHVERSYLQVLVATGRKDTSD